MKTFCIYKRTEEDIILIQEGFNIRAAVFGVFWAIYNKLWIFAAVGAVFYFFQILQILPQAQGAIKIFVFLFFGFLSDFFYQFELERKGYIFDDIIIAPNIYEAELQYYKRNMLKAPNENIDFCHGT